jgi:catecholate siderophore receptor
MFKTSMPLAAARLLMGSSLTTAGLATITLALAAPAFAQTELSPVQVQGEGAGSYTAPSGLSKLTEPLLDTPVSVTTVTQQLMQDRGNTNLNDALRNVPSVTLESSESSWEGNAPYIRGFSARTDMFMDGMRDIGMYYRDPFNLNQVEVLEGPDSILFGRGSTGGVIEQDSKTPEQEQFTNLSASGGTNSLARVTADVNLPLENTGVPTAIRLNAMFNTNGIAERDVARFTRFGFAPSLTLGLGTDTRFTASYFYQSENDIPDFGVPWCFGVPCAVPRNNYYGYRSDRLKTSANVGTVKLEHDFTDWLTISAQSRWASYSRNETAGKPTLATNVTATTPFSAAGTTLTDFTLRSTEMQFQNQVNGVAKFATGDIQHDLEVGAEYDKESSDPKYFTNTGLTNTLLNPNENQIFTPALTYQRVNINTKTNTEAGYFVDTMKLDNFQLILGARIDRFSVHFNEQAYSVPPATTGVVTATNVTNRVDTLPSWHGALLYKPMDNGTVYFSYGTSFNPSAETLDIISSFTSFSLANANIGPERNRNLELGTKWAFFDGGLNASASLFETDKTNARIPDLSLPGFNTLGGNQRVQGFELAAQGKIMDGWNASIGYDYLSSDTTKTVAGGPPLGFPLPFTPHNHVTVWTTYQIFPELEIGGGGEYMGSRYAQTTAPIEKAPDYFTLDAMAKYTINDKFDVQVNVYNLTDKYYIDMMHPQFAVPGAGRSAMLTLNYHP